MIEPKRAFWQLAGSLKSNRVLSDKELKEAREAFGKQWPRKSSRLGWDQAHDGTILTFDTSLLKKIV